MEAAADSDDDDEEELPDALADFFRDYSTRLVEATCCNPDAEPSLPTGPCVPRRHTAYSMGVHPRRTGR